MSTLCTPLLSTDLASCSSDLLLSALQQAGGLILRGILPVELVQKAHRDARLALEEENGYVQWQLYDRESRTGYTPTGVEGTVRSGPNFHRHFFDYRPGFVSLDPVQDVLRPIHERLVEVGEQLLERLDRGIGTSVLTTTAQDGLHALRIAHCLNDTVSPEIELFPEHRDYNILTFFVGGASPGLEIRMGNEWVGAQPAAGEVLVGAGTVLKQYLPCTQSLRHRIMAHSSRRLSLFQFIEPVSSAVLPNGETAAEYYARIMSKVRKDM